MLPSDIAVEVSPGMLFGSRGSRWALKPLGALVSSLFVGIPVSRHAAKSGEDSITLPILSVGDLEDERLSHPDRIPRVNLRPLNVDRFRVQAGDVLVSCRGTLLKTALVHSADGVLASSNIITIRPNSKLLSSQLILAFLRMPAWRDALAARSRSATGMVQLTIKDLQDLPAPVPPEHVQRELTELLDAEEHARRAALLTIDERRSLVEAVLTKVLFVDSGEDSQ